MKEELDLRRGMGVLLVIAWNWPFVLLFWHSWGFVLLLVSFNCVAWAIYMVAMRRSRLLRSIIFRAGAEEPENQRKFLGGALLMLVYAAAALIGAFFEKD